MSIRSNSLRRLLAAVAVAATAAGLMPAPAAADDLPAPTVRRSSQRAVPSTPRATPRRSTPARSAVAQRTAVRPSPSRTVTSQGTRPYGTPYVRPARDRAISEPTAWSRGKRHSTYVPPAGASASRQAPRSTSVPATSVPTATPKSTAYTFRRAPAPISSPPRSTASRTSVPLSKPETRRTSPSYADLERTRPNHMVSRSRASTNSTSLRRQRYERRQQPTRRSLGRSATSGSGAGRSTSVPAAPGEQVQPVPSTIRQLPLKPRPGCCGDG